jgi:signal recognition particle subunit SRP54
MVLEELSSALREAFRKFASRPYAEEQAINEFIKDIQRSLLKADVEVGLVLQLSDAIRKTAKEKPPSGVSKKEQIIHRVYTELVNILGREKSTIDVSGPGVKKLLFVGIQGSGKTTTLAKVARLFQKKGLKVAVICADTYRPGALQQLTQLLDPYGIPVYGNEEEKDPVRLIKDMIKQVKDCKVLLIDTAGRHKDEKSLMEEVKNISKELGTDAAVLVIDSTIGQQARAQAEAFSKTVPIGYIILTKMDGTAKGGGALSAVAATGAPVVFIGTGEKVENLEEFDPVKFTSSLLGVVDLKEIIRKVEAAFSLEDEERVKAITRGRFTLEDFVLQVEALGRPGILSSISKMLPSSTKLPEGWEEKSSSMAKVWRSILDSMNREEREDASILNSSRIKRIAKGSGRSEKEVRELIKQYALAKKMIRRMKGARGLRTPFR